jgi:hypothetical protein
LTIRVGGMMVAVASFAIAITEGSLMRDEPVTLDFLAAQLLKLLEEMRDARSEISAMRDDMRVLKSRRCRRSLALLKFESWAASPSHASGFSRAPMPVSSLGR